MLGVDQTIRERQQETTMRSGRVPRYRAVTQSRRHGASQRRQPPDQVLNRLRATLLANVSHELRTPIQHIMLSTWILQQQHRSLEDDATDAYLQGIMDACQRLATQ